MPLRLKIAAVSDKFRRPLSGKPSTARGKGEPYKEFATRSVAGPPLLVPEGQRPEGENVARFSPGDEVWVTGNTPNASGQPGAYALALGKSGDITKYPLAHPRQSTFDPADPKAVFFPIGTEGRVHSSGRNSVIVDMTSERGTSALWHMLPSDLGSVEQRGQKQLFVPGKIGDPLRVTLREIADISVGSLDADFWIHRRGPLPALGLPSTEPLRQGFAVKLLRLPYTSRKDIIQQVAKVWETGVFQQLAEGPAGKKTLPITKVEMIPILINDYGPEPGNIRPGGRRQAGIDMKRAGSIRILAAMARPYHSREFHTRTAAGTEDDIRAQLPILEEGCRGMKEAVETAITEALLSPTFFVSFKAAIHAGKKVVAGVLSQRSIPAGKSKPMEMVYRLLDNTNDYPKNGVKWWQTNGKRLEFLIEAAKTWPPKQVGGDELFVLEPFKVHNTVGARGAELESLKKGLERVVDAVKSNPIPGFSRVLYGDVHVVANVGKGDHAAWYYPRDDSIYLRRTKATGMDEVNGLIHELGHRYWRKFASEDQKKAWSQYHSELSSKKEALPKKGDQLPIVFEGLPPDQRPYITKIEGGRYYFALIFNERYYSHSLTKAEISKFYSRRHIAKNFPTPYSSTSDEEHFCESLALLALGNLPDEFEIPFKAIWA